MTEPSIWIITATETAEETGAKSSFDRGPSYGQPESNRHQRTQVSAQALQANITEFLTVVETAFDKAEQSQTKMQLEEVELVVEVNGKGQVSLWGTGGEVGGKGAITLKFKRKN
ncbi:MAG: Pepco domain-containing protein [Microcystaceae cyanobacterium]